MQIIAARGRRRDTWEGGTHASYLLDNAKLGEEAAVDIFNLAPSKQTNNTNNLFRNQFDKCFKLVCVRVRVCMCVCDGGADSHQAHVQLSTLASFIGQLQSEVRVVRMVRVGQVVKLSLSASVCVCVCVECVA